MPQQTPKAQPIPPPTLDFSDLGARKIDFSDLGATPVPERKRPIGATGSWTTTEPRLSAGRTVVDQVTGLAEGAAGALTGYDPQNPLSSSLKWVTGLRGLEMLGNAAKQGSASTGRGPIVGGAAELMKSAIQSVPYSASQTVSGLSKLGSDPKQGAREVGEGLAIGIPAALGTRAAVKGAIRSTNTGRAFMEAPTHEPPDITFQHATKSKIPVDDIPVVMDQLAEFSQRTGKPIRSQVEAQQAGNVQRSLLNGIYESVIRPQRNIIVPDSRRAWYDAQVKAIPDNIRIDDTALYSRTMRKLQNDLKKPDFTIGEMDDIRSALSKEPTKTLTAEITNDHILTRAMKEAQANVARDSVYKFLDTRGLGHGSLLREINHRVGSLIHFEDAMRKLESPANLETGQTKFRKAMEFGGKVTNPFETIRSMGKGELTKINAGIRDAMSRWRTPEPLPTAWPVGSTRNRLLTSGQVPPTKMWGPPNPLYGNYGTTAHPIPPLPKVEPPMIDPITGQVVPRYQPKREP